MNNWTPVLNGDIYCSPACGRGCTLEEYNQTVKEADQLVAELGEPFHSHVWENLGWHYSASAEVPGEAFVTVHYSENVKRYWADLRVAGRQETAYGNDAKNAVATAIAAMQAKVNQAIVELANINMLLTNS